MIDLYCERTAAGLLGEPFNAASNLAFFVAAAAAGCEAWQRGRRDGLALAALLALIGLGSSAFHTFATAWAQWLDVVPIALFQVAFLACYLMRSCHHGAARTTCVVLTFVFTLGVAGRLPALANGSLAYLPAAVVLAWMGYDAWRRDRCVLLLAAAALFPLSLLARTVDLAVCTAWPHGSHWLWHALNGVVLWLAVTGYLRSSGRAADRPASAA